MSDAAEVFKEVRVPCNGRELVMRRPTFATEAGLSRYLEVQELEGVMRDRGRLGPEYEAARDQVFRNRAKRIWRWGSRDTVEALQLEPAWKELVYLTLFQADNDLSRAQFDVIWEQASVEGCGHCQGTGKVDGSCCPLCAGTAQLQAYPMKRALTEALNEVLASPLFSLGPAPAPSP